MTARSRGFSALPFLCFLAIFVVPSSPARSEDRRAEVVDATHLAIRGKVARLQGLEAPASHELCGDDRGAERSCAELAVAALQRAIAGGVVCETDLNEGLQANAVFCSAGGKDVAALLIRTGYVRLDRRFLKWKKRSARPHAIEYQVAEDEARSAGVGVWRGAPGREGRAR